MSVTKEDLLQLASDLCLCAAEVQWRAAVSRAYYGADHGCRAWHAAMPVPASTSGMQGGVHQQLLNQLGNGAPEWSASQKMLGRVLSAHLRALKDRRKIADYDLDESFDQALAASHCAAAGLLLSKLP